MNFTTSDKKSDPFRSFLPQTESTSTRDGASAQAPGFYPGFSQSEKDLEFSHIEFTQLLEKHERILNGNFLPGLCKDERVALPQVDKSLSSASAQETFPQVETSSVSTSQKSHGIDVIMYDGALLPLGVGLAYLYAKYFLTFIPLSALFIAASAVTFYSLLSTLTKFFKKPQAFDAIWDLFVPTNTTRLYLSDTEASKVNTEFDNKIVDTGVGSKRSDVLDIKTNTQVSSTYNNNSSNVMSGPNMTYSNHPEFKKPKEVFSFAQASTINHEKLIDSPNTSIVGHVLKHSLVKPNCTGFDSYKTVPVCPASSILGAFGDLKSYLYLSPEETADSLNLSSDLSKMDIKARIWTAQKILIPLYRDIVAVDKELISKDLIHLTCEKPGQNRPPVSSTTSTSTIGTAPKSSQTSSNISTVLDQAVPSLSSTAPTTSATISTPAASSSSATKPLYGGTSFSSGGAVGNTFGSLGASIKPIGSQTEFPFDLVDLYKWVTSPSEPSKSALALRRLKIERFLSICSSAYSRRALINRLKDLSENPLLGEFQGDYGKIQVPLDETLGSSLSASEIKLSPGLPITDTQLLIHLILTHFDLFSEADKNFKLDNYDFSSTRFVPYGDSSSHKDGPYLKQLAPGASHLVIVNPNHSVIYDIIRGDCNLFLALVTFATLVHRIVPEGHPLSQIDWTELVVPEIKKLAA